MTSNLKSEYILDLEIQDNTKEAIRNLESGLSRIGKAAKDSIKSGDLAGGLKDAQKAADQMIAKFHELAKDQDVDFNALLKSYTKNSNKAVSELELMYVGLKSRLNEVEKQHEENNRLIEVYKDLLKKSSNDANKIAKINKQLNDLEKEQQSLNYEGLKAQVEQNREIRKQLILAGKIAKYDRDRTKLGKLKELQAKRAVTTDQNEIKRLDEKIKRQKMIVKSIELAEKATSKLGKAWNFVLKHADRIGKLTQFAYAASGMAAGAGKALISGGRAVTGMISGAVSQAAQAADRDLEKERVANRVKGYDINPAKEILGELYIKTGADYSTIVDAINRVQGALGGRASLSKGDLIAATEVELKYPGASLAFASTKTYANVENYNKYANRMKAIQHATGASDEQINASIQMFANMRPENFNNAKITELQTIYLGLQNSGAFESQDELDRVFESFVKKQRESGKDPFELAAHGFVWTDAIDDRRKKLQAQNTLKNLDWNSLSLTTEINNTSSMKKSDSETMAMRMRQLEEQKNKLLMTLIPAAIPLVESLAEVLEGDSAKRIADGFGEIFKTVVPLLVTVLRYFDQYILQNLKIAMDWLASKFGQDETTAEIKKINQQKSAGGLALMPSIVGERGPEAIIPLDFARSQRAANIATNITQTFNMGTSQTTALSLAQAVKSRDFTRAMSENAFITRRCGVF